MPPNINHCAAYGRKMVTAFSKTFATIRFNKAGGVFKRKQGQPLLSLPVEILQLIRDFLPPSSAASFALCSRALLDAVGNNPFHSLRADDHMIERRRFLVAMQKDLPEWLLCYHCSRFHPLRLDEGPDATWRYIREPICTQANGVIYLTQSFRIRFQHAQSLMNNYRFGRPYKQQLKGLSHKYSLSDHTAKLKGNVRSFIEKGNLYVRTRSTLRLPDSCGMGLIQQWMLPVCNHLESYCCNQTLWDTIKCRLNQGHTERCTKCKKRNACGQCITWYQVKIKRDRANKEVVLRLLVWKDLGACETPFDREWREHAEPRLRSVVIGPTRAAHWASDDVSGDDMKSMLVFEGLDLSARVCHPIAWPLLRTS